MPVGKERVASEENTVHGSNRLEVGEREEGEEEMRRSRNTLFSWVFHKRIPREPIHKLALGLIN